MALMRRVPSLPVVTYWLALGQSENKKDHEADQRENKGAPDKSSDRNTGEDAKIKEEDREFDREDFGGVQRLADVERLWQISLGLLNVGNVPDAKKLRDPFSADSPCILSQSIR